MASREPLVQAALTSTTEGPEGHVVVPRVAHGTDDEAVAAVRRKEAVLGVAILGAEEIHQDRADEGGGRLLELQVDQFVRDDRHLGSTTQPPGIPR